MNGFRQCGSRRGRLGVGEESLVVVPRKSGAILLLPSSSHRVAVEDTEEVVHRPQDRVVIDQRVLQRRMSPRVHIVVDTMQESAGYLQVHVFFVENRGIFLRIALTGESAVERVRSPQYSRVGRVMLAEVEAEVGDRQPA